MKRIQLTLIYFIISTTILSQETLPDSVCLFIDENLGVSIVDNDMIYDPNNPALIPFLLDQNPCFRLTETGILSLLPGADPSTCCGEHRLFYSYTGTQIMEQIDVTVKCNAPKPDCSIVDLDDYKELDSSGIKTILNACEESAIVYHVDELPGVDYTWNTGGIPYTFLAGDYSIEVVWPNSGSYTITLTESVGGIITETYTFCINVIDSPDAAFSVVNGCGCLNSPVSFNNMSAGGTSFFWDFGDGNTSSDVNPTNTYTTPGIYTVTLYVTEDNVDPQGNPLCCCTDSIQHDVIIDPKEGPPIYWISTLCEGDTSKYWTTAEVCDYMWSVTDASGAIVPIVSSPLNNDTICVVWGNGPYGVVSLQVDNCTMGDYCDKPVSAIVPIIQSNSDITGRDTVCAFTTHNYSVPKWGTVEYEWSIDPPSAGAITAGQGQNVVTINWFSAPTTATINVNYTSDFLEGLPGHEEGDCSGMASLEVDIFPEYDMIAPTSPLCINQTATFSTTLPAINGFTWEVSPSPGLITGLLNSPLSLSFTSAGTYTVKVYPNYPNPFCNDTIVRFVNVIEVLPPDSISGAKEICLDDTELYFGNGSYPGTTYMWSVSGGTIIGSNTGNPLTVNWDGLPPYQVFVKNVLIDDMTCFSDSIFCPIDVKSLVPFDSISVDMACVNKTGFATVYPDQHDDATYTWTIMPSNMGSIIGGNYSTNPEIQWNDVSGSATLICKAYLCGDSVMISKTITVNEATPPIIIQSDTLCPGETVTLDAGSGYASYVWSPSGSGQIITVGSAGNYVVTVTDANMCTAVSNHQVLAYPSPNVTISTIGDEDLCIGQGGSVEIHGMDGDVSIEWFKDGASLGPGIPNQATITHTNSNIVGSCTYCYIATDNSTGCTAKSNTVVITQSVCTGGTGGGCTPTQSTTFNLNATNQTPACNKVDFSTSFTGGPVTVTGWFFDDPFGTLSGPFLTPTYEFSEAKYYTVEVYGTVPANGGGTCAVQAEAVVCIPLVADFTCSVECDTARFEDASTFITGSNITSWMWDFGDGGTSTMQDPDHTYLLPGSYDVVLVVSNGTCTDTFEKEVVIPMTSIPIINIPPDACVGEEVIFNHTNPSGIVAWDWNFGDGSSNGDDNPSHAYTMGGTYSVTLVVTDETGCTGSASTSILIHPAPSPDTISYSPDLVLCDGEDLILSAPNGIMFSWNTGDMVQDITVNTSGTYAVTIFDANGCVYIPDSVEVTVLPPIDSTITGPTTICDDGCITLYAPQFFGYTYQWSNQGGGLLGTDYDQEICFIDGVTELNLLITDANACTAQNSVMIQYASSPSVSISSSDPSLCEGVPILLTANVFPAGPAYDYQWSTTATSPSITVLSAGVYTVVVTDPTTGCSDTESITINPIPDLCIVPHGCYTACDPDTLCGPDGLTSYAWTKDGVFFGNTQCVEVTESGAYNLTGVNSFNCSNTSDTLFLDIIPCCQPDDTEVLSKVADGDCCYNLSYIITPDYFDKLTIRSDEAEINLDYLSLNPDLQVVSNVGGYVINNSTAGQPIPNGAYLDFVTICLEDAVVDPVRVIFDWMYGDEMCSDTLELECAAEPDCIYITNDTLYCEGNLWVYQVDICNPGDAETSIGYIDIINILPSGLSMTPSFILLGTPLLPGECRTFTFTINGSNLANTNFYFDLIGHENNPNQDPGTFCCSLDTTYCYFIPGCSPCDSVYVSSIDSSDIDECCYDVTVHNYYDDMIFSGIDVCVLTSGASITSSNTSSNWTTNSISPTAISWDYNSTTSTIPLGFSTLPTICIDETEIASVEIEIKWMHGSDVMCRDTIILTCSGDCGLMSNIEVLCSPQGGWTISGYITNTSSDTMNTAYIDWGAPIDSLYNFTLNLGNLPPGATYGPFNIYIAGTAPSGTELCAITTLHTLGHDNEHEECCNFKTIIPLPDCINDKPCLCDKSFKDLVAQGTNCTPISNTNYGFNPYAQFSECDFFMWQIDGVEVGFSNHDQTFAYNFPGPGEYEVCMIVIRTASNGKQCKREYCKEVMIVGASQLKVFPNPVLGELNVSFTSMSTDKMANIEMYSIANGLVLTTKAQINENVSTFDVSGLHTGTYIMKVRIGEEEFTKYIFIID